MSTNPFIIRVGFSSAKTPVFKEVKNKEWVYYGEDNAYPEVLLEYYNLSSKNNAIINSKTSYVVGNGIVYDTENVPAEARSNYDKFLKHANKNDSLNELFKKCAQDYEIFNGFAIEVIPNKTRTGIGSFCHVDFSKIRSNESGDTFYYTSKWVKKDGEKYVPNPTPQKEKDYRIYPRFEKLEQYAADRYLIYFKCYRPGIRTYTLPDYQGACSAIETDIRITNYHLSNIKNGFSASKLINFNNGVPQPEQQDKIEESIKEKFTGDKNAGTFVLFFNDGTERAATVLDLTAGDLDKQFDQVRKDTDQEIYVGHRVTSPILFGVKTEGQLGARNEIIEAFELFKKGYINERQEMFETFFNDLAILMGLQPVFYIKPTEPIDIKVDLSEATITQNLTRDEIRSLISKQTGMQLEASVPTSGDTTPVSNMSIELDDERDIPVFLKYGTHKGGYERVYSRAVNFANQVNDHKFKASIIQFDRSFSDLDKLERDALEKIKEGKYDDIKVSVINRLREKKLVEIKEDTGEPSLTDLGELTIADIPDLSDKKLSELKVVYEYGLRPGESGGEVIPTTRPFCKALVESDKYFTRQDIDSISSEVGYDVWKHRGGWITLSNGNHRPSCRHIWNQVLVKEIAK